MFLHIGRGKLLKKSSIIGVFDLEITSQSKRTKSFLSKTCVTIFRVPL